MSGALINARRKVTQKRPGAQGYLEFLLKVFKTVCVLIDAQLQSCQCRHMSKPKFSVKEHEKLAPEIAALRDQLFTFRMRVSNAYGVSDRRVLPHLIKSLAELDHAIAILDTDYLNLPFAKIPSPYYPPG